MALISSPSPSGGRCPKGVRGNKIFSNPPKKDGSLFYLTILTGFFILLELSYFVQCNKTYLGVFTFVSKNLHIPATIIPGVLYFLGAQIFIHALYCLGLWIIIELLTGFIPILARNKIYIIIAIWLLSVLTIFTANQYYFPNSKFTELTSFLLFNQAVTSLVYYFLASCWALIMLVTSFVLLQRLYIYKQLKFLFIPVLMILMDHYYFQPKFAAENIAATSARPNIILIGIDSLRPDFLGYFGADKATPFLDSLLEQSTVFAEAVTPLARTFPSWSSLLTGQYPRETHIRSNLSEQTKLNLNETLTAILQRNGYETIYATDETRFSNLDKNFGFNRIVSPPMGLNDFLIGSFNDFPLSNLLVNTKLGKVLFPHSYANRPVDFTYNPDSFLELLRPVLAEKRQRPLFLATHFCLTHAPYLWADYSGKDMSAEERYIASIQRVDTQIRDYFALLKQNHLLEHAIVVLLSDHGETLEFSGDRITEKDLFVASAAASSMPAFYPQGVSHEEVNQTAGHGTDVMGLPQYHTLLAFKLYGVGQSAHIGNISGVVSLLDIKPTVLELLQLQAPAVSGISLLNEIQGNILTANFSNRHVFLESDYSPAAIRTVYPEVKEVMLQGIDIFQINPKTTRLTVKKSMAAKIIASKQYADIYQDWMLALYPQANNKRIAILINLNSGQWTSDLHSEFAQHSPAELMMEKLRGFYGDEVL